MLETMHLLSPRQQLCLTILHPYIWWVPMSLFSLRTSRVSKLHVPVLVFPECVSKPTLPSVSGQAFLLSICVLLCPFRCVSQLGLGRQASRMLSFSQLKNPYSVELWAEHSAPYLSLCLWLLGPLENHFQALASPLQRIGSSSLSGIWPCAFLGTEVRYSSSSSHKNNFVNVVPQLGVLHLIKQCMQCAIYL